MVAAEVFMAIFCVLCAVLSVRYARRAGRSARFVASQLAPAGVVSPRCAACGGPLQAAREPYNGQTHYCPTCQLWAVVVGAPGGS